MKRFLVLVLLLIGTPALAQQQLGLAKAVVTCGGQSLTTGLIYPVTQDLTGTLCITASGGSSGAVTIADGADVTQGAKADATCGTATGTCSEISLLKYLNAAVIDTTPVNVYELPTTTGGLSVYTVQPAASDNHATIKAGAGQVYKISITGNGSQTTVQYVRLYNATSGFNGCNSATNLIYSNSIPFSSNGAGLLDLWSNGMSFSTGISICITGGYGNTDTTNATASAMNVNIGYK